jgi:hypothetical protein
MKKLIVLGVFAIIGWTSFYDVTKGTLNFIGNPSTVQPAAASVQPPNSKPFRSVSIKAGDTVLSINEKLNPSSDINIQQVISDFQTLNNGADPNHIQIGKNYRFPLYSSEN